MESKKSLHRSYTFVLEMFKERRYETDAEYKTVDFEEFNDWIENAGGEQNYRKKLEITGTKPSGKKVVAVWVNSLGVSEVQLLYDRILKMDINHCICIYETKITSYATSAIKSLKVKRTNIETFSEEETQIVITKHEYVPRHIICSEATKKQILEKYSVTTSQLPMIKSTDPVAKFLGATRGQLIKIVRENESMPFVVMSPDKKKDLLEISYRIVL